MSEISELSVLEDISDMEIESDAYDPSQQSIAEGLSEPPSLPSEPPSLLDRLGSTTPSRLPSTRSALFTKRLYTRALDADPTLIHYTCTQPGCGYSPKPTPLSFNNSGNLWKHYHTSKKGDHKELAARYGRSETSTVVSSASSVRSRTSFFQPRPITKRRNDDFRKMRLHLLVTNNLPLRLVDSPSFRSFIQFLNPTVTLYSRYTLKRDLKETFHTNRELLKQELHQHIATGGRISLTTDSRQAGNYKDHAAITVHWIDANWEPNSKILDVVFLEEPVHSGKYLAKKLLEITNGLDITKALFTVTRDSASSNTEMLRWVEEDAKQLEESIELPWPFTVQEGDVRCMAHIINLAVQDALKCLKADAAVSLNIH